MSNVWRRRPRLLGWFMLLSLVATGCSGLKGSPPMNDSVEGTIKLEGIPVAGVTLQFVPEGEERLPASNALTDEQGRFKLRCDNKKPGAVIGKHHVTIMVPRGDARTGDPQAGGDTAAAARKIPEVPAAYRQAAKTPLIVDVTADQHNYELTLVRAPK